MLRKLYQFNQVTGLAIHTAADGNPVMDICTLTLEDKQLSIEKKISGLRQLDELSKHLPAKAIIAVNLTGKGVFTKQLDNVEEINPANFSKILPNANLDDFYVQQITSGDFSFVSVVRKTEANKWFELLHEKDYEPVILSLGPFVMMNILSELNLYDETIVFNGHIIERNEHGTWLNYRYDALAQAEFKIKIQNENISENLLLPYASAFQLILQEQLDPICAVAAPYDELFTQQLTDRKAKANGIVILIIFFILLLINFGLFSWLQSSNEQISLHLSKTQQHTNVVMANSSQIKEKESLLNGLGWDNNNKSAFIDQLAAMLPHDIRWTEVTVNPVASEESQQAKMLTFINRSIKISGLADKVLSVNEWMARIKTKAWVKSARLENYVYNNELNTGVFTINITY